MTASNRPGPPRTKRAARTIRLDEETLEILNQWREEQQGLRQLAGTAWAKFGLIASTGLGTAIDRNHFVRSLQRVSKQAGIDPVVGRYELRHTAITD